MLFRYRASSYPETLDAGEQARRLEQALVDDGALLLKFWLHLPPDERQKRLKRAHKDPVSVRLTERDLELYERFDEAEPLIEAFLRRTSTAAAPWVLVESAHPRHRNLTVAREVRDAFVRRLAEPPVEPAPAPPAKRTCASAGTGTSRRGSAGSMAYDAFISYSHGADLELAPALRVGLQRLARPWNPRRALSIFLDQASLELSSELGSSLDQRLEGTRWLVLFMSEESAQSRWVGEEIAEWGATKSKDQMALVLTSGERKSTSS